MRSPYAADEARALSRLLDNFGIISKSSPMSEGSILIVAPSAYPLGGVATWIDYIVPGLRRRGWQVTLGLTEGTLHNVDAYLAVHPMQGVIRIPNWTATREGR